ncbi:hypothetical protein ACWU4D_15340 [Vibrio sp. WJH972]
MFECSRNNRPIPSQDNLQKVIDMYGYTFDFPQDSNLPVMFVNEKIIDNREKQFLIIWERCLALDFVFLGLERAVKFAVWERLNQCWEERGRSK